LPSASSKTPLATSKTPPAGAVSEVASWTEKAYQFAHGCLKSYQDSPLPPVPAYYNISELSLTPTCHTNFEPRRQNALADILVPQHTNWALELSFLDSAAVARSAERGLGYIDRKNIFASTGVNSSIAFTVRHSAASRLWLCEVQKGFSKYPVFEADLDAGAQMYVQYHYQQDRALPSTEVVTDNSTSSYSLPDLSKFSKMGKLTANC
jgi:hypothetical protein